MRAFGKAVVPQVAAAFVRAYIEASPHGRFAELGNRGIMPDPKEETL